ncbi:MAG: hypothetical protein IJT15_00800, partial [Rickettsiales bacterium]|nr:hypothetical protein [Rickettsiales bacterium]
WIEYFYIFTPENKWKYYKYDYPELRDVKEDLDQYYKNIGIKRPKDYYGFWTDEAIAKEKKKQQNQDTEM